MEEVDKGCPVIRMMGVSGWVSSGMRPTLSQQLTAKRRIAEANSLDNSGTYSRERACWCPPIYLLLWGGGPGANTSTRLIKASDNSNQYATATADANSTLNSNPSF